MNLFIDTISPKACIILFDNLRKILKKEFFDIKLQESEKLSSKIDDFINKCGIGYFDIENIVVVAGPGSFTWVRSTVLIINTIAYCTKSMITSLSYFDLFDTYPIIKTSSKRDVFIKESRLSEIKIIKNEEIKNLKIKNTLSWDVNFDFLKNYCIISIPDYENIIKNLSLDNKKIISPIYIKKPNIC